MTERVAARLRMDREAVRGTAHPDAGKLLTGRGVDDVELGVVPARQPQDSAVRGDAARVGAAAVRQAPIRGPSALLTSSAERAPSPRFRLYIAWESRLTQDGARRSAARVERRHDKAVAGRRHVHHADLGRGWRGGECGTAVRGRESFYWLAVLLTISLSSATGDLVSERMDFGYWLSAVLFALLIAAIALAHFALGLDAVWSFWIAYVLTRPLGASIGDYLSQPTDDGGLGLGTVVTSVLFLGVVLGLVVYLAVTRKDVPQLHRAARQAA